jgi:general nucleoside transport system ATP-binding protein
MSNGVPSAPPDIEVIDLCKSFGALRALDGVSVRFRTGRVHALLGENGAGKSTLVKCLMGYYRADAGQLLVDGHQRAILHPRDAHALGLGMVYQHFTLVPQMTVAENFLLGRRHLPAVIDWRVEHCALDKFMARMPFRLDPRRMVATLAAGEKQKLEILKQLYLGRRFIVLDEPTSVLTPSEADEVLGEVRRLSDARLLTVVLITHKLREVMRFAQDVSVLRGGKVMAHTDIATASEVSLARMMFGAPSSVEKPEQSRKSVPPTVAPYLELKGIHALGDRGAPAVVGASISVRPGEIVGIAGVSGNGQKELVQILAGQREAHSGSIRVDGHVFHGTRPELERWGVSVLIEEPLVNAAVPAMSVMENLALRQFDRPPLAIAGWVLKRRALRPFARDLIARYGIRVGSASEPLQTLSGGNIQRTVLARELARPVRLLIMQNPCFGLDVAAATEIRRQIMRVRNDGVAVLLISEDLDEVLELSDRVLVMAGGGVSYETDRANADRYVIGRHMTQGLPRLSA